MSIKTSTDYTITWNFPDVLSKIKIEISRDAGETWTTLTTQADNTGTYVWRVTLPATTQAQIRCSGQLYEDPEGIDIDFSDITDISENFTIEANVATQSFLVTIPTALVAATESVMDVRVDMAKIPAAVKTAFFTALASDFSNLAVYTYPALVEVGRIAGDIDKVNSAGNLWFKAAPSATTAKQYLVACGDSISGKTDDLTVLSDTGVLMRHSCKEATGNYIDTMGNYDGTPYLSGQQRGLATPMYMGYRTVGGYYTSIGNVSAMDNSAQYALMIIMKSGGTVTNPQVLFNSASANSVLIDAYLDDLYYDHNVSDGYNIRAKITGMVSGVLPSWHLNTSIFNGAAADNAGRMRVNINGVDQTPSYTGTFGATCPNSAGNFYIGNTTDLYFGEIRVYNDVSKLTANFLLSWKQINFDNALTYAEQTFAVTFDSQGGSAVDAQSIHNNDLVAEPTDPTRTGYTFGGWYKEAECSTAWTFATDTVTAAVTIYAKWIANATPTKKKSGTWLNQAFRSLSFR